ncbi:MAG: hypothetical protein R6X08_00785, partial [Desulfosalsimonadaceae bacterium]
DALRDGDFLRTPDIAEKVSRASGRDVKIQDIASILTKITSYRISDVACLIEKKKTHRGYAYRLVDAALQLSPRQIYDLTRKTRKNNRPRFTLEQALELCPELEKHVSSRCRANREKRQTAKIPNSRGGRMHPRSLPEGAPGQFSSFLSALLEDQGVNINLNLYVYLNGAEGKNLHSV